jgi:hypothetical protein
MKTTSSSNFQRKIGRYQDRALVEPIIVTRNGRERLVLMSGLFRQVKDGITGWVRTQKLQVTPRE